MTSQPTINIRHVLASIEKAFSDLDDHTHNYECNIAVTMARFECTEAEAKAFLAESKAEVIKRLDELTAKYRSL
jgi:hypothetical protein